MQVGIAVSFFHSFLAFSCFRWKAQGYSNNTDEVDLHFLLFPLNCMGGDVIPCFIKRGEEKAEHMGLSDKQKIQIHGKILQRKFLL
jgi:hypothetical protein